MEWRLTHAAVLLSEAALPDMPAPFRERFEQERYRAVCWSDRPFLQDLQEAWTGERRPFARVTVPQTSHFALESVVAAAAVRVAARYNLTVRATWLVCVSTRHSRLRDASRYLGLGVRRTEDLSGEIRASGVALRDLVSETMWVALGSVRDDAEAQDEASRVVGAQSRRARVTGT